MKKLLLVLAVALCSPCVAGRECRRVGPTVGLGSLPRWHVSAGDKWSVELTILQHGRSPLDGIAPVL